MLGDEIKVKEGSLELSGGKPLSRLNNKELGALGEGCAAVYLEDQGLELLDRNWRCDAGEADIICRDGDEVVLVEVKTRYKASCKLDPLPELAVDGRKQRRYQKIALIYMSYHYPCEHVRFDVVAINMYDGGTYCLRHLIRAYECDE